MARRRRKHAAPAATRSPPLAVDRAASRVASVDALRGLAILTMIAYHFAFDLDFFGVIDADFDHDRFWLSARAAIVSSFLLLVGVSLVLADRTGLPWTARFRRVASIALCALAVSVASYFVYPQTYIYFGILHCIALSLLLAAPLARRPLLALLLGLAVVFAGLALSHPVFDARPTSWLGFTTHKPPTQDFVPLFPWLGTVLLGIALGHALLRTRFAPIAPLARAPRALLWLGRHSLAVYIAHQPILMGSLWLVLLRPAE